MESDKQPHSVYAQIRLTKLAQIPGLASSEINVMPSANRQIGLPFHPVHDRVTSQNIHKRTHHHQVLGDPAVRREVLKHGDQELEAAIPVTQQKHHPNQVNDPHHGAGQVIGHMEDLRKRRRGKSETVDV